MSAGSTKLTMGDAGSPSVHSVGLSDDDEHWGRYLSTDADRRDRRELAEFRGDDAPRPDDSGRGPTASWSTTVVTDGSWEWSSPVAGAGGRRSPWPPGWRAISNVRMPAAVFAAPVASWASVVGLTSTTPVVVG